jgi:hypothetical protein
MFKMKYLINKMQCNILSQQVGGLMVGAFASILKVKRSNLTSGVCGQQW